MQILTDENGYVVGFALIGNIIDGIEVEDPKDADHFEQHYKAYKLQDGALVFDALQQEQEDLEQAQAEYRRRREKECFSIINRGQLWYEGISLPQLLELRKWYQAWLKVTDTMVVPERPAWLE